MPWHIRIDPLNPHSIEEDFEEIESLFSKWVKNVINSRLRCQDTQDASVIEKELDENKKEMQALRRKIKEKLKKNQFYSTEESQHLESILKALKKYDRSSQDLYPNPTTLSTSTSTAWGKVRAVITTLNPMITIPKTLASIRAVMRPSKPQKKQIDTLEKIAEWAEYCEKQSLSLDLLIWRRSENDTVQKKYLRIAESIYQESLKNDVRTDKLFSYQNNELFEDYDREMQAKMRFIGQLLHLSGIAINCKEMIAWMKANTACSRAVKQLLTAFRPSFYGDKKAPIINDNFRIAHQQEIETLKNAIETFKEKQTVFFEMLKKTSADIQNLVSEKNMSEIKTSLYTSKPEFLKDLPEHSPIRKTTEAVEEYLKVLNMAAVMARATDEKTAQQYYGLLLSHAYQNILKTIPKQRMSTFKRKIREESTYMDREKINLYFPPYSALSQQYIQAPHLKNGPGFLMAIISELESARSESTLKHPVTKSCIVERTSEDVGRENDALLTSTQNEDAERRKKIQ